MIPIFTGNTRAKIIDISAGFQHTIMLSGKISKRINYFTNTNFVSLKIRGFATDAEKLLGGR
jgi:hypothetical protein